MEIKRGYKLSQFIDEVSKRLSEPINCSQYAGAFITVQKYNELLKQPLKIEQFVNEVEKPMPGYHNSKHWLAAEKKVIFKGWYSLNNYVTNNDYRYSNGWLEDMVDGGIKTEINTLGDLFEATNGELELQNVEL